MKMALLTMSKRKEYFAYLGLGEYTKANIKKIQAKYMYAKYVDGIYGVLTDNLLRTLYNIKKNTKNFSAKEFRCECGGKYCCGYPAAMNASVLKNLQKVRDKYGKPITITCGLRDKKYNASLSGSVSNSRHLQGKAVDFYQSGSTDTVQHRKSLIKYLKKLPKHNYSYGNGCSSTGASVNAANMGNAIHTDVK